MPVWAFHGEKDQVVPADESRALVRAVERAGGSAKLTIYPDTEHNSWDRAYEDEELPKWLLEHKRPPG
jgi:dipeptidyl aminopeptidase/acylaminoacyl peptidase